MTPASWTDDDWQDAWDMLTGQWATLRRAGAEAGYRAVLTRFPVQAVAEAVLDFIATSEDEPKAAAIAAHLRSHAPRPATPDVEREHDEPHRPSSLRVALDIAERRRARGQSLGLAQWVALGCPCSSPSLEETAEGMLARVGRLVAEDDQPLVAVSADAARSGSRAVVGIGSVGPAIRAALRVANEHDRDLALRRLKHVMTPDEHALLCEGLVP